MRFSLILSATAMAVCATTAAAQQPPAPLSLQPAGTQRIPLDRIVANVGDVIVTQSMLQERIIQKRADGVQLPQDSTAFRAYALTVLNEIVDEELLLQKGKELKIEVPDVDVNSTVDKQYKDIRKRFTSDAEFRTELQKAGYGTPDEYKHFLGDQIRRTESIQRTVRKLREDGKVSQANVTDAEVADSYERNRAVMPRREPSVAWRQIIISPHASKVNKEIARVKAETLLAELKRGADFAKVAKRESMDAGSKENGGDLGWNRRGKMVKEFDQWMFALPPDQLSPVVETGYGYHIIRVDRIQPAEVKARHILIAPKIDSADVQRARIEGDTVRAQLAAGGSFDSLAKLHHDFKSGEETTILTPFPRAQLPLAYQQGFADKKPKDIVLFPIPGNELVSEKTVVAQVVSMETGGEFTLPEIKERLRARLAEEGGVKRLMDSLRKGTYVNIHTDALIMAGPPPVVAKP